MSPSSLKTEPPRKRVLVIGMLDSIHFARWLAQFEDQNIDFVILASKKFRHINPHLTSLLSGKQIAKYEFPSFGLLPVISGYLDFITFVMMRRIFGLDLRSKHLGYILRKSNFHYLHALEIQGAGYLISSVNAELYSGSKVILTNWGSDIYFYQNESNQKALIQRALAKADYYSAECIRDYDLARQLGFNGIDLPCIPNAGGFNLNGSIGNYSLTSDRKQILIKGYGNTFGRVDLFIQQLPLIASAFPDIYFHFYSVTEDTLKLLKNVCGEFSSRVRITTAKEKLTHSEMISEFERSRIYVGCSESDGISTSFLESLITGCYPIQTNTSCANEWVKKGAIASIIPLEDVALFREINRALLDDDHVNRAAIANRQVADIHLGLDVIREQSLKFYS